MSTLARRHGSWTCACAAAAIALLQLAGPARATAQTVLSNDWEDGTVQGWGPRGSVVLTNTTEAAATGTRSLKTTNRSAGWNGPSLNVLSSLTPGITYQFKVSARLAPGESATQLKLTVERKTTDGRTEYDTVVSSTNATDGAWVTLQGAYKAPFCVTGLVLYVESTSATAAFYLDDFTITVIPVVACSDTTGIQTTFETGAAEGWGPRGGVTLTPTTADSHTGAYSLLTTGRTSSWMGPSINVAGKMCNGSRYHISVWVKLAPGESPAQLRLSMQRSFGGATTYPWIVGNTNVTADQWVNLQANYDLTVDYDSLSLYVESNGGTVPFYIDDFQLAWTAFLPPTPPPYCPAGPPIATGQDKFLGCAYSNAQKVNFTMYWDQVTPENGGKWGTVEGTRDTMVWTEMDAAYNLAKAKGFPVKLHTLVWGSQQPGWMASLSPADQLAEIEEWFAAAAARYPDVDQVDVVNEPLHQVLPSYVNALGGAGATGWDWVINAFRLARTYFPTSQLLINEYSVTNSTTDMERYIAIIRLLQAENLIDGVGVQGHYFSTRSYSGDLAATSAQQKANLDLLAARTGLPIYVTELDIDGPTDDIQLSEYERIFPIFWEHPAVEGITLWGYRPGLWRANANLVYENGAERPAMAWLKGYIPDTRPAIAVGQSFRIDGGTCNVIGTVAASDPDTGTRPDLAMLQDWKIVGGSGQGIFAVDAATGTIRIAKPLDIDFSRTSYEIVVSVSDGFRPSEPQTVTITIPRKIDVVHKGRPISISKEDVPNHLRGHGDCLGTAGSGN